MTGNVLSEYIQVINKFGISSNEAKVFEEKYKTDTVITERIAIIKRIYKGRIDRLYN